YLRHSFHMNVDSNAWRQQADQFRSACVAAQQPLPPVQHRGDDRAQSVFIPPKNVFANEADTDFTLAANRKWITRFLSACRERADNGAYTVASLIAGERADSGERLPGFDPSRPHVVPYEVRLSGGADVERALSTAVTAQSEQRPVEQRMAWLRAAAHALREARGELIALMVLDAGKRVLEADVEVSEAIDF